MFWNPRRSDVLFHMKVVIIAVLCWFHCVDGLTDNLNVDSKGVTTISSGNYIQMCNENDYRDNQTCCDRDEFQCGAGACIPLDKVCNSNLIISINEVDCIDASDEIGCNIETCAVRTPKCPHHCIDLPNNKSLCSCYRGYQIETDMFNISCVDVDECAVGVHSCSHDCINLNGTFKCSCREGFQKDSEKSSNFCYTDAKETLVLFYERDWIYSYNLTTGYTLTVVHSGKVTSMDYDPKTDILYWSNSTSVTRSYLPGAKNGTVTIGHPQLLEGPEFRDNIVRESIAIDWTSGNLYWLSPDTFNELVSQIMVSKLDGRYVKTLIEIPRASSFVLDPEFQRMYWSCGGDDPHIGSAWMNGMLRSIVVRLPNQNPVALTLDHLSNGRLYWVDSLHHTIYYVFKFGSKTRKVYTTTPDRSPISLDVFEKNLYWVTKETGEVFTIDKFGIGEVKPLFGYLDNDSLVKIYHKRKIEKKIQGGVFCSDQCSHLCLLMPRGYTCTCPDGNRIVPIGGEIVCDNEQRKPMEDPLVCNCRNKEMFRNASSPYSQCSCDDYDHESEHHTFNNYVVTIPPHTIILGCIVLVLVMAATVLSCYKKDNVLLDSNALVQTTSSIF